MGTKRGCDRFAERLKYILDNPEEKLLTAI